jgi:hypothetical protein
MLKIKTTADLQQKAPTKVLLYAHHGYGKTYQCRYYAKRYGKGLIISGESGLKSLEDVDIDYVEFTSWMEFEDIYRYLSGLIKNGNFAKTGYKWIAIDSLTELSDRLVEMNEDKYKGKDGDIDRSKSFAMWAEYSRRMIGVLKWLRDLPVHVYMCCLAKEEESANGSSKEFWPMVAGSKTQKQIPALFDHVFCGKKVEVTDPDTGKITVKRYLIADEVSGWHGKVRDPYGVIKAYEEESDVTELLARMSTATAKNQKEKWSK